MLRHPSTASDAPRSHTRKVSVMPRIARPARLAMATAAVAALLALAGCSASADPAASSADPAAVYAARISDRLVVPACTTRMTAPTNIASPPSVVTRSACRAARRLAPRAW